MPRRTTRRFAFIVAMAALGPTACELNEITLAEPTDLLVVEVVLKAGDTVQTAFLHRTVSVAGGARIFDAAVTVREDGGSQPMVFTADADSLCLFPAPPIPPFPAGTCYVARGRAALVRPGSRYTLDVVLPDGRRLTGSTRVPGDFAMVRPPAPCRLAAGAGMDLGWTRSEGASVYIGETRMENLVAALRAAGVEVERPDTPIDLLGLAIGSADTTMTFPGEFGLFDRADPDLHGILLAIREGLPPGVRADIAIAAADRNYVNWVRGGAFNPSGTVRVPSLHGDGTGLIGSLVIRRTAVDTGDADLPSCP
jgi:hypothetical protein